MNEALKKPEKHRKKYKLLTFIIDKEKDSDIIDWLESKKNRSAAVRELIRRENKHE